MAVYVPVGRPKTLHGEVHITFWGDQPVHILPFDPKYHEQFVILYFSQVKFFPWDKLWMNRFSSTCTCNALHSSLLWSMLPISGGVQVAYLLFIFYVFSFGFVLLFVVSVSVFFALSLPLDF